MENETDFNNFIGSDVVQPSKPKQTKKRRKKNEYEEVRHDDDGEISGGPIVIRSPERIDAPVLVASTIQLNPSLGGVFTNRNSKSIIYTESETTSGGEKLQKRKNKISNSSFNLIDVSEDEQEEFIENTENQGKEEEEEGEQTNQQEVGLKRKKTRSIRSNEAGDIMEDLFGIKNSKLKREMIISIKNERERAMQALKPLFDSFAVVMESSISARELEESYLDHMLRQLETLWSFPTDLSGHERSLLIYEMVLFNLRVPNTDRDLSFASIDEIEGLFDKNIIFLTNQLQLRFALANLIYNAAHPRSLQYHNRFYNLYAKQGAATEIFCNMWLVHRCDTQPENYLTTTQSFGLIKYIPRSIMDKTNPFGKFLIHCLIHLQKRGWRRYQGDLYSPRYNPKKQFTFAWKREMTILDFVWSAVKVDIDSKNFSNIISSPNIVKHTSDYLTYLKSHYLPDLNRTRYLLSFRNGIYNVSNATFYPFDFIFSKNQVDFHTKEIHIDGIDMNPNNKKEIDLEFLKNFAACNYLDLEFYDYSDVEDWYDIPTPNMDHIIKCQQWDEKTNRLFYSLHGRFLYWSDELENNKQFVLAEWGRAGTGKSTTLKGLRDIYPRENVAIISNNIERNFALVSLVGPHIYVDIGMEIKHNFKWDQAEFQQAAECDDVHIQRKNKDPIKQKFRSPIFLAMNEWPKTLQDSGGSLKRRVVAFPFSKMISKKDLRTDLSQLIFQELPAIIQKINRGYRQFIEELGSKDIWSEGVLSKTLIDANNEIMQQAHPLLHFFSSCSKLVFHPDEYCTFDEFQKLFNEWCHNTGYKKIQFTNDFYKSIFEDYNIIKGYDTKPSAPNIRQEYVTGLGIRRDQSI